MHRYLRKLCQKSRLDVYRALLYEALAAGYRVSSLIDWYRNGYYPGEKVFLLRHDVDSDSEGAYKMYQIECELNVRSTFYFRWFSMRTGIMQAMHRSGFEVSLHYETLATYCKQQHIRQAQAVSDSIKRICFDRLCDEIAEFRRRFWPIDSIASHGDKRNRLLGIPNHVILNYGDRARLGIQFEAYDPEITRRFDHYIADSSVAQGFHWRYGMAPGEAFAKQLTTICLLTHPRHWNFSWRKKLRSVALDIRERLA